MDFPRFLVDCRKKIKVIEGFGAFDGRIKFRDWYADAMRVGYKTGPTNPFQIGGVRLSETKGAHKSQALIIVDVRTVSSRECRIGGQPKMGCRLRYFEKS